MKSNWLFLVMMAFSLVELAATEATEKAEGVAPLACVQNLQLSIGAEGYTKVLPEMILADKYPGLQSLSQ